MAWCHAVLQYPSDCRQLITTITIIMLVMVKKIFAFLSSLWALADMVLDTVTVVRYRAMCQVGVVLLSQCHP